MGKIGGHNVTPTKAKTLFEDTTCDILLTEYENRFLPFHLAELFLAWNSIWLRINSCSFQLHIMLPAQLTPSPVYPALQVHVKECLVLVQYASLWQLCCPVLHSSTNQQVKVSYKNFLDLNVSHVSTNSWYHDLLIKIHWENVGINTPKKVLHLRPVIVWCCWPMWLLYKWNLTFGNQYFGDTRKDMKCF